MGWVSGNATSHPRRHRNSAWYFMGERSVAYLGVNGCPNGAGKAKPGALSPPYVRPRFSRRPATDRTNACFWLILKERGQRTLTQRGLVRRMRIAHLSDLHLLEPHLGRRSLTRRVRLGYLSLFRPLDVD